jgi:hypothetical protein
MFGRRAFLTLMAIGALAGAPALGAQALGHPHHARASAEWRHRGDHWVRRRVWLERRERRRHFARRHWHRHWDGII